MNWEGGTRKKSVLSYLPGIRMNHTLSVQEDDQPVAAYVASLSILVQLFMLGCTFMIGHVLRRNKITIVPEAGAALLVGVLVGMLVRMSGEGNGFSSWIDFNNEFFFYFLLPPIIFESGWSLKTRPFFGNFGAICTFALLGTLISTFAVGTLIYIFGSLNWTHSMPFLVCLTFGALISATDPVTVLAVFNELGVDANLYAYVFGESVLNDAVAIVMYRTVLSFVGNEISRGGILAAFSYFIANFIGSFSIGSLCAIGSALLVKYGHLNDHGLGVLESCLMVLFPYAAYMMADALELSGIVSILFTGIAMKHYTAPLMSSVAQTITTNFFQMLAKLSETFVFIYMGVALFLEEQSWNSLGFTFFTIISILIARALNVYPCSVFVNKYRETSRHIPMNQQHALCYSGLRGAMAFALALQSVTDLPDNHGRVLLTSTLFTIFFTVLFVGGTTPDCLTYLKIEMTRSSAGHSELEANEPMPATTHIDTPVEGSDDETEAGDLGILERHKAKLQKKLRKLKKDADFAKLDKKYIKPFFTSPTDSQPTSPRSPDRDVTSEVNLARLPARANERRSLVADAFYARTDPFPTPSGNRKLPKLASGGNKQVDSSWSVSPGRRRSSQELETWSDSAATIPSIPTESFHPVEIKTTNFPGEQEVVLLGERNKPQEVSWPSAGGWATNVKSLDPRGVVPQLRAGLQPQNMTNSQKSPSSWNPEGTGDRCKMHPTAHQSVGSDFATIDLT